MQHRKPYSVLIFIAFAIGAVATHPRGVLVVLAYGYLLSAFIGQAMTRLRHRQSDRHGGADAALASDVNRPAI
jgi:hypothetical protein